MKNKLHRLYFVFLLSLVSTIGLQAQTTIYFETFNTGSSTTWTLNTTDLGSDPANTNYWIINNTYNGGFLGGTTPNEPAAVTGNPTSYYMHINNNLAGNASFQGPMTGDVFTKMNTAINTVGYTGVNFNFWYLSKGHNTSTTAYIGRAYYSIDGGVNWILLASYSQIAVWTNASITNAAFDNQPDLRFAFMWHQAGGSGAKDPCLAVDEIKVTGTSGTPCGVSITNQSSTQPTCNNSNNGTITITATGATVYTINSGSAQTNATGAFTGLAPGTYTVSAGDGTCTTNGTNITISNPAAVAVPTASSNSPLCVGGTLQLNAANVTNATYNWTGPNTFNATQNPSKANVTTADAGVYSVIATVGGCNSAASTTTVVVNTIPSAPTASNNGPLCAGATLQLNATNVTNATYNWTGPNAFPNQQNPSKANVTTGDAGTYSVVDVVSGCTSPAATTTVVINPAPTSATASNNGPICAGATLQLSATTVANATYNWTGPNIFNNQQNPSKTNATTSDAGTYSLVTVVSGCSSIASTTTVVVNALPTGLTASSNTPVCVGATLQLNATAINNATYNWTGPNNFNNQQNPSKANVTTGDAGTYNVIATVGNCSSAPASTLVVVNTIPNSPTASNNGPLCEGATLQLNATVISNATYNWTGPNNFTNQQNPSKSNTTIGDAGTYSVVAVVNGCNSSSSSTTVVINPIPATPTASSNSPLCVGDNLQLNATVINNASYNWTGPNNFNNQQNPTKNNVTIGDSGTYSVIATVGNCSSNAATTVVSISNTPTAPTASSNSPVCEGAMLNLTASVVSGASYAWTGPNNFNQQNPSKANVLGTDSGTYSVVATIGSCVSAPATVTVSVDPTPVISVTTSNSPVCEGQTLNLNATTINGATYSWTGPNGFSQSSPSRPGITLADTGTYSVVATLGNCTSSPSPSTSTLVVVNTVPVATISANPTIICSSDSSQICAGNFAAYLWNTGDSAICIIAKQAGNYYVTVTDNNGCTAASNHVALSAYSIPAVSISVQGDTLSSQNATGYQWYLNGVEIPNAIASQYVATQTGVYSLQITDSNGCHALSNGTQIVVTGIQELSTVAGFELYPNPAKDLLTIIWKSAAITEKQVEVVDLSGRVVYMTKANASTGSNLTIDISQYAKGIYLVKAGGRWRKFVKE